VVRATRRSQATRFVAVASRDGDRAGQFAAAFGLDHAFASYEALLESDSVDAVYVALPNAMHAEWTIKALRDIGGGEITSRGDADSGCGPEPGCVSCHIR
jgi:predicted dehydrogenase